MDVGLGTRYCILKKMSGSRARRGFRFQDAFLLSRVLDELRLVLSDAWNRPGESEAGWTDGLSHTFGVEAKPRSESASRLTENLLDWDVSARLPDRDEWIEVKSGSVSKEDRRAFWCRMRETLSALQDDGGRFHPGLAADPTELDDLERWQELAVEATRFAGTPPQEEPTVRTSTGLLEEALWWTCQAPEQTSGSPMVPIPVALRALRQFKLYLCPYEELDARMAASVATLFPGGPTETFCRQLRDWVNERAQHPDPQRHYFTAREMLAELCVLERALAADPAAFRRWRTLWDTWPKLVQSRTHSSIGEHGVSLPMQVTQPEAVDALTKSNRPAVIIAPAGLGKTTLLSQLGDMWSQAGEIVMRCGAGDLEHDQWRDFEDSVQFRASLAALEATPKRIFLLVDGLDETDEDERDVVIDLLARLGQITHLRVVVSVRDAVWREQPAWRAKLAGWDFVQLEAWREATVKEIIAITDFANEISGSLLSLLRTPILLDLFWRTFVEGETAANATDIAQIQTRHGILAAFWQARLFQGPRRGALSRTEVNFGLESVSARCAENLGPFGECGLSPPIVSFLALESVLVREERLHATLRFRHPLIRDFALAQYCLATGNAKDAVDRWTSIHSGLQREGCLRALLEALVDPQAGNDYEITLSDFLSSLCTRLPPDRIQSLARALGILLPGDGLDPALWPPSAVKVLPQRFASDLLQSAQNHLNEAWATRVARWPETAGWFDEELPARVMNYGEVMLDRFHNTKSPEFRYAAISAATRLRFWSRHPKFRPCFEDNDAWLLSAAIEFVSHADGGDATFHWIEQNLSAPTWRVRNAILKVVPYLAHQDARRTAAIFRRASSLSDAGTPPRILDGNVFFQLQHCALDNQIIGPDPRSVLCRFSEAFLPVALDLAVALRRLHEDDTREEREERERRLAEAFGDKSEPRRVDSMGGLIDDYPAITLWQNPFRTEPHTHILGEIQGATTQLYDTDHERFWISLAPMLRACPLATVQSLLLDLSVKHVVEPQAASFLEEMVCEIRLYQVTDLWPWLEEGLELLWPTASGELRSTILRAIEQTVQLPAGDYLYPQLLCRLPADALTDEQRTLVAAHRSAGRGERDHHMNMTCRSDGEWKKVDVLEEWERWGGEWPSDFDVSLIKEFYGAAEPLSPDADEAQIASSLPKALALGQQVLAELLARLDVLVNPRNQWVIHRLTRIFQENLRYAQLTDTPAKEFPESFVLGCADLAKRLMSGGPGELSTLEPQEPNYTPPALLWVSALDLLQAAMAYPPLAADAAAQESFEQLLVQAFRQGPAAIQQAICVLVHPWHWVRSANRRALHDRLFWQEASHGIVVKWSLWRLRYLSQAGREARCRRFLQRTDFIRPEPLAKALGEFVGRHALAFINETRPPMSGLAQEIIENPDNFPLLRNSEVRRDFLHSLLRGLTESAKQSCSHTMLAADYGRWALDIWLLLRADPSTGSQRSVTLLSVMHWLDKHSRQNISDPTALVHWWRAILPMLFAAIREGDRSDVDQVFEQLCDNDYAGVMPIEDLLALITALCERLRADSAIPPINGGYGSRDRGHWQEIADHAALGIDSAHQIGQLNTPVLLEHAYGLLTSLANAPEASRAATRVLQRIQHAEG